MLSHALRAAAVLLALAAGSAAPAAAQSPAAGSPGQQGTPGNQTGPAQQPAPGQQPGAGQQPGPGQQTSPAAPNGVGQPGQTQPDPSTANGEPPAGIRQPGTFPMKGTSPQRGPAGQRADAAMNNRQRPERRPVSLKEALDLASRQGPDVAFARAQASVASVSIDRYWTAWKPDISATGTFDHTSAPAVFDIAGLINQISLAITGAPVPAGTRLPGAVTIVGANSTYGTLQIAQPLLTPQGLFLKGPAEAGAEAAARGADEAREQVLLGVARAYLSLKGLEGLLAAAQDAEKVALSRESDARVQIRAGTAVEIALLRAQTETAQARAQIAGLVGQRESLLALLEGLVGEPISLQPASNAEADLGPGADESQQPWEQTYGVQSAIAQVRAAHGVVRYDQFQWLPTVAAIAKGNYNSNGGFSGQTASYDLILNVSIPLYDRGARYVAKKEDDARLAQAQANLAATRARARSNWAGARANLTASESVLAQAESQAALAKRAQEQVEIAAKAGVTTSLDLSDADNKRFAAESSAAQARANVDLRRAELAASEGRLFRSIAGR